MAESFQETQNFAKNEAMINRGPHFWYLLEVTDSSTGKLSSITDARGSTTSWTYNEQDLVATETNPLGFSEHYLYDGDGLMIQKTLRSGEVLSYEYDVTKRLKKVTTPNDTVVWNYDHDGLPLSVEDNDSSVTWNYDGVGRLIKETQTHAPAPLRFFYDQNRGQLIRRTLGFQISEGLGYNEDRALTALVYKHYGVSRSVRMTRDELNRSVKTSFGQGGSVTRAFDGVGRLLNLETKNSSNATVGSFSFGYDPNSNITVIDQVIDEVTTPKSYVYDSENRLVEAQHGSTTEAWNLDLLGNWSGNGRVFNKGNQIIEDQEYFYSYDPRGNLIQKSAKVGIEVTVFSWDFFDRLTEVETTEKRISFKYDATGRRIERHVEDKLSSTTKTSRWSYLNDDQWTESNELGQVLAVTLNGESIDDVVSMSLKDVNQATPGVSVDPIKDHLGSIYGWATPSGEVIQKQSYSAYGETKIESASIVFNQLGNLRGYTSREYDKELGIYYYRARYYNPAIGMFLSPDPIGFRSGDTNYYRYVFNNPVGYTDPSGLFVPPPFIIVPINNLPKPPPSDPHTSTPLEKGGYLLYKDGQLPTEQEKNKNFDNYWDNMFNNEDNEYDHISCPNKA